MHVVLFLLLFGDGARPDLPAPKTDTDVPRRYRLPPPPPPPPAPAAKPKKETAAERKKRLAEEKRIRKMLEALSVKDGQQVGLIGVLRSGDSSGSIFGSDLAGGGFGTGGLGTGTAVGSGGGGKGWGTIGVGRLGGGSTSPPESDRAAAHRVVEAHKSSIKYCYEKELANKPDLAGRVVTRFKVDETGAVTEANVTSSTLGDANVETCVLNQIRSWKFPAKATTIIYPFRFENGG